MNHIIEIETDASTLSKIVAYIRSLKIKFSVKETEESPYDPEFVKMVLEARKGKRKRINPNNVWESIM